jgi:hypothetical protein
VILSPKKCLLEDLLELGFSSVRHNANLTQGVNFQNPCVGRLWAPWSCGIGHTHLPELTELSYVTDCDFVPPDGCTIARVRTVRRLHYS